MKRLKSRNKKIAGSNFVLDEYNIDHENETFGPKSSTEANLSGNNENYFAFRPKELSFATQFMACQHHKSRHMLTRNPKTHTGISLNLAPNLFDQLLYAFYEARYDTNYTVVFTLFTYAVILTLIGDFVQNLSYFCTTSSQFLVDKRIRVRLALSTVIK